MSQLDVLNRVFEVAEDKLGIPTSLEPTSVLYRPSMQATMTYIACFKAYTRDTGVCIMILLLMYRLMCLHYHHLNHRHHLVSWYGVVMTS